MSTGANQTAASFLPGLRIHTDTNQYPISDPLIQIQENHVDRLEL